MSSTLSASIPGPVSLKVCDTSNPNSGKCVESIIIKGNIADRKGNALGKIETRVRYFIPPRPFHPLPAIYDARLSDITDVMMKAEKRAIVGLGDYSEPMVVEPQNRDRLVNINTAKDRIRNLEAIKG